MVLLFANVYKSAKYCHKLLNSSRSRFVKIVDIPYSVIHCQKMEGSVLSPPAEVRGEKRTRGIRTAGVIIIGDEVLKGTVKDDNSFFLCRRLHSLGVKLVKISVIGDTLEGIAQEVRLFSNNFDLVITTGGIGPTHDDITYEAIAKAFDVGLKSNDELLSMWTRFYSKNKIDAASKMSLIPENARIVHASIPKKVLGSGYFPFVVIKNVYVFPGIPSYMKAGFHAMEKEHFTGWDNKFYQKALYFSVDESSMLKQLNSTVNKFIQTVEIGSYPVVANPFYRTKVTFESSEKAQMEDALSHFKSAVKPSWLVPEGDLLGNAPHNLTDMMETNENIAFVTLLNNSLSVLDQCYKKYSEKEVFLCFNGGKDCTALLHLVHSYLLGREDRKPTSIQALYIRGKDPFHQVEDFIKETADRYLLDLKVVEGPIKPALEQVIKENKDWKAVLMGTRRTDPNSSGLSSFQMTDTGWPQVMRVSPLLDWNYADVWCFLRTLSVPYCTLYDQGYTSLGSQTNTKPNSKLAYTEGGEVKYHPAYLLEDSDCERSGRK